MSVPGLFTCTPQAYCFEATTTTKKLNDLLTLHLADAKGKVNK